MIDKWIYKFFCTLDDMFSWVETYSIKLTTWLWNSRVNILKRKRRRK